MPCRGVTLGHGCKKGGAGRPLGHGGTCTAPGKTRVLQEARAEGLGGRGDGRAAGREAGHVGEPSDHAGLASKVRGRRQSGKQGSREVEERRRGPGENRGLRPGAGGAQEGGSRG